MKKKTLKLTETELATIQSALNHYENHCYDILVKENEKAKEKNQICMFHPNFAKTITHDINLQLREAGADIKSSLISVEVKDREYKG